MSRALKALRLLSDMRRLSFGIVSVVDVKTYVYITAPFDRAPWLRF